MRAIYVALLGALFAISAPDLNAAQIAFDTAGDSAYNNFNNVNYPYPNGGYGWGGPWQAQADALNLSSSSLNGFGDPLSTGDINSPRTPAGRAWQIRAVPESDLNSFNVFSTVWRPFNGALLPGQTFAIDLDTGAVAPTGGFAQGFSLAQGEDSLMSRGTGFRFEAAPDYSPDYLIATPTASLVTDIPLTDQGVHIEVTQLDGAQINVSVISLPSGGASQSVVLPDSVPITAVTVDNFEPATLVNGFDDLYFNNIAITPEPASVVMFSLAAAGIILRRQRRGKPSC